MALHPDAQRTVDAVRAAAKHYGIDPEPLVQRLLSGFEQYGESNHRSPDFDLLAEWKQEAQDCFMFAVMAADQGVVPGDREAVGFWDPMLGSCCTLRYIEELQAETTGECERDTP